MLVVAGGQQKLRVGGQETSGPADNRSPGGRPAALRTAVYVNGTTPLAGGGLGQAGLRDGQPPVPVERRRAQGGRVGLQREPAAHLLRVRVPRQRVGEADRHPQRLVDRPGADEPLVGEPEVRALDGEPLQRVAPMGARGLRREPLAELDEVVRVPELGGPQVVGALDRELTHGVEHRQPVEPGSYLLVKEGEFWAVGREGSVFRLKDSRGLNLLFTLVSQPDREVHVLDLSGSSGVRMSDTGPAIDATTRTAYRARLVQLEEDIEEAHAFSDLARASQLEVEKAAIVSSPRIFEGLTAPPRHGETPQDMAARARMVDSARAAGGYIVVTDGGTQVLGPGFVRARLDSIVQARGGTGAPTAADSAALRAALPAIAEYQNAQAAARRRQRSGPTQCHDITVYPAIGLAGGACGGYGLLLDISDAANPKRIAAVADSNFSFWHSATFNNDGTKVIFTDEWGGGTRPRCRSSDQLSWGANAIFDIVDRKLRFGGYYKIPAPQTEQENCVAHNGSLIPVPGRDIMVQAWYQGGLSVFDFTDSARPFEIAYFDRGPIDPKQLIIGGYWSTYWYNGAIYGSEIARGVDVFRLKPGEHLAQSEIEAATLIRSEALNTQAQTKVTWPATSVVARAYLDQLARTRGIQPERARAVRAALERADDVRSPQDRNAAAVLDQARGRVTTRN